MNISHRITLEEFIKEKYLRFVKEEVRPSVFRGYRSIANAHIYGKTDCQYHLQSYTTAMCQDILRRIAQRKLTKSTLSHIKFFLSGAFVYAMQCELADRNPVKDCRISRKGKASAETHAYTLDEIMRIVTVLPEPASTVVLTAAFTGLRRGELQATVWENLEPGEPYGLYAVTSSIWQSHRDEPKTPTSNQRILVIPALAERLEIHRLRGGNPQSGPIFADTEGNPLCMNNLRYRVIVPALNRCEICLRRKGDHSNANHEFKRDESLPEWKGWHAFRRGLASNLFELGCDELTVQRILRHSTVQVTRDHYIKLRDSKVESAMRKLSMATDEMFPSPMKIKSKWIN